MFWIDSISFLSKLHTTSTALVRADDKLIVITFFFAP